MTIDKCNPSATSKDNGFSLLEMIVVLSVVSMIAVIGLASTQRNARKASVNEALNQVQAIALRARSAAISGSRSVLFELHFENGALSIDGKQNVLISKELKIDFTGASELVDKENAKFLFNPDGSSSGGAIKITDRFGKKGLMIVNWLTGIPRVEQVSK